MDSHYTSVRSQGATEHSIGLIYLPGIDTPGAVRDIADRHDNLHFASSGSPYTENFWIRFMLGATEAVCSNSFDSFNLPWSAVDPMSPEFLLSDVHSSPDSRLGSLRSSHLDHDSTSGHLESTIDLNPPFEQLLEMSDTNSTDGALHLPSVWNDWDFESTFVSAHTFANCANTLPPPYQTVEMTDASRVGDCLPTAPAYNTLPHKSASEIRVEEVLVPDQISIGQPGKHGAGDDPSHSAKRIKLEKQSPGERIACPYFKRFPESFGSRRTCLGPGFDGMNRLKEHLHRKHLKKFACDRCGKNLGNNKRLDDHMRALEPCFAVVVQPDQGFMSHPQWNEIQANTRKHGVEVEDKWRQIYLVLFPDANPSAIPGPFFDGFAASQDRKHQVTENG
ncbi:hypothetical protein MCOR25_002246 [Pyricularia grisea]|nr:hypothetical protein MCOR25_002246 [Pyricularia grisea]